MRTAFVIRTRYTLASDTKFWGVPAVGTVRVVVVHSDATAGEKGRSRGRARGGKEEERRQSWADANGKTSHKQKHTIA